MKYGKLGGEKYGAPAELSLAVLDVKGWRKEAFYSRL